MARRKTQTTANTANRKVTTATTDATTAQVKKERLVAATGNDGNSPEPHLETPEMGVVTTDEKPAPQDEVPIVDPEQGIGGGATQAPIDVTVPEGASLTEKLEPAQGTLQQNEEAIAHDAARTEEKRKLPKTPPPEVKAKQDKADGKRTPPSNRPLRNPFTKIQEDREAKRKQRVPKTPVEMKKQLEEAGITVGDNLLLSGLVSHLDNYVSAMAPNTPIEKSAAVKLQSQLATDIFSALSAPADISNAALIIIETYFKSYKKAALSRTHVYRFLEEVPLSNSKQLAFQAMLHLFIELADSGDLSRAEISRKVSIRKIADYLPDNKDAQIRLVEFMR